MRPNGSFPKPNLCWPSARFPLLPHDFPGRFSAKESRRDTLKIEVSTCLKTPRIIFPAECREHFPPRYRNTDGMDFSLKTHPGAKTRLKFNFFQKKRRKCLVDIAKQRIFATKKNSCRDDNAYSLVKSSLVFVLVAGGLKRGAVRLFFCPYRNETRNEARNGMRRQATHDDRVRPGGWSWRDRAAPRRTGAPSDG